MQIATCPSCNFEVQSTFRFCPNCGENLNSPITCDNCGTENIPSSKFCAQCGSSLSISNNKTKKKDSKVGEEINLEPPSDLGIVVEFSYSTSQSYDLAVKEAQTFQSYRVFGEDKKTIHRVNIDEAEIERVVVLVGHLKGIRKKTVYVKGAKTPWENVFSFAWCFEKKKASYKPEYYCFGYENEYNFNIFGCIHTDLYFNSFGEWFCWGVWLNADGDWKFDKERIRHEVYKNLHEYKYCPALNIDRIEDVLSAMPDVVNPKKDNNWKFVERYGDDNVASGLRVVTQVGGYEDTIIARGVAPNGNGAMFEIEKKLKFKLPQENE